MPEKKKTFKTTCSYCGVGCGIVIEKNYNGSIKVRGDKEHPANKGKLCSKGMNLHYVVNDISDRFLYPEMRYARNLPRVRVDWDQALDRAAAVFKTFIKKHGPDSVGFYVSGQCLTEEYYIVNKLAKGFIGTNNIDTNSRLCMSSAVVGYKKALGEDAVPVSYNDIELADCFFITGANPAWCHPILFRRLEAHKKANPNVKIIVADPRKTQSCNIADIHLQLNPGTDITLNNALAKLIIDKGYADEGFLSNHTEGYNILLKGLRAFDVREAAKNCGIELALLEETADFIGQSKGFISMWAMGLNQSAEGVNKNLSLLNLSLITGKIGKPGNGPLSLTGQPNAMGGREVGGMCNLLPAHRDLGNAEHRQEVANFWNVGSVPEKPGYTATEMFDALLDDKLKAIWIICTNPLVSLPNARKYEEALKKAKFVIVQDISKNSITAQYADMVLPAAGWLEKEGSMTNSDRRISYLPKLTEAPGEALPDVDILCGFADKMGYKGFSFKNTEGIFKEHAALTKGTNINIDGLDYTHLKQKGTVQWPFNKLTGKGTTRLFSDFKFYTPTGNARLHFVQEDKKNSNDKYPLILTTGRIRDQWHTLTRTGKVNRLNQHIADCYLEIHPSDAASRGIIDNSVVCVSNGFGETQVKAIITDRIKQGVVFLPMHWGKILQSDLTRANNLTSNRIDPVSKEPDYKYSGVQVRPFVKEKQTIVVVGAGAAAYQFIHSYRELNNTDSITVFSKEKHPFYNRVQLPDYVSGHKNWDDLAKSTESEIAALNVTLHTATGIGNISPECKTVIDDKGNSHAYDVLILATGSRAFAPEHVDLKTNGIYTIRNREDADRLMQQTYKDSHATIIGAGLLGLEMASSLIELGVNVSLINRNRKLMDRQLDAIASKLLSELIEHKGVKIYFNDEVESHEANPAKGGFHVKLKSGKQLQSDSIVYAIGTRPNIGIAQSAMLETRRGIIVDEYLKTSDPNIYAMGEIAECNGKLYGITPAAEEQAKIVAAHLNGDITSFYKGSTMVNILKFPGVELCTIGDNFPADDSECEEIVFVDKAAHYYKKCLIKNDRLIGAILLGDKGEYVEFKKMIDSGSELSEMRLKLLRSNAPAKPLKGKVVCSCNNVGEENLLDSIKEGNLTLEKLCEDTGAGLGCGSCKPEVSAILNTQLIAHA